MLSGGGGVDGEVVQTVGTIPFFQSEFLGSTSLSDPFLVEFLRSHFRSRKVSTLSFTDFTKGPSI